jgi:tRNA pseudouridine32 synthase / 23S rRNA pseudouridine746 synthase
VRDATGCPVQGAGLYAMHAGTRLSYQRELAVEPHIAVQEQVLFEDDNLLIADKPHFLPILPAGRYVEQTLLTRLQRRLNLPELAPAHRIDQGTAGVVLFTKRASVRNQYHALFREHRVHKLYEAIAPWNAQLHFPQRRFSHLQSAAHFMQMREAVGMAPNSETLITLVEQRGAWARYALEPRTGKRHQLRVHMAALGLPLQNDPIYPTLLPEKVAPEGDTAKQDTINYAAPLKLLAKTLAFIDPITRDERAFHSRFRLDFDAL